jgi:uncharacterized protein (TIGR02594 family)
VALHPAHHIEADPMDAFQLAAQQIGLNERDQNAALQDYLSTGGVNLDPAVTAWCAAYVNATLAQTGQKGTGSNMARSFMDWGTGVDQPQKGDLAVFSRGDPNGPYGHVGFFEGYNPDGTIRVLGGNQGDGVSVASYSADDLLGFRRGEGGQSGNALAGMGPPQSPQNALAQEPVFQMADQRLDVTPFLNPNRNALAMMRG